MAVPDQHPVATSLHAGHLARIAAAITRQTGLSAEAGLNARLERALRDHDNEHVGHLARLLEAKRWNEPEWQALITQVLVHETYLFRDWLQLEHLKQAGMPGCIQHARTTGTRSLCLWSAGCSSGEEAYSLAALCLHAMLDAGVASRRHERIDPASGWVIEVIGSDISRDVLARADAGAFSTEGLSPFRAMQPDYVDLFPVLEPDMPLTRGVREDLRRHVRFVHDNLLDGPPPVIGADVVVCRNVLIYLTDEARVSALDKLAAAVGPHGYLVLGPTDPPPPSKTFEALWSAGPVIYRRRPPP